MISILMFIGGLLWLYLGYIAIDDQDRFWVFYSWIRKRWGESPKRDEEWEKEQQRNGCMFLVSAFIWFGLAYVLLPK